MTRTHWILVGALAVQIGLGVWMWQSDDPFLRADERPFVSAEAEAVSAIELADDDGEPLRFERSGDGWVLASADDFPADGDALDELAANLGGLTIGDAIASQVKNHAALGVADASYDRRVTLEVGGATHTFFVGRGSGSSLHVRRAGEDEVFQARGMAMGDLGTTLGRWIETKVVDVPAADLSRVTIANANGEVDLSKAGDTWALAQAPIGAELDSSTVSSLTNDASNVFMDRPVGTTTEPGYGLDGGTRVTLAWNVDDGLETLSYTIGSATEDGEAFYARVDGGSHVVRVPKRRAERLRDVVASELLKERAAAEQAVGSDGGAGLPKLPDALPTPTAPLGAGGG